MRFLFLWGLLMAAALSSFPGPVSALVFPATQLRGALTRDLPDASNTTTATEADPVFVLTPGSGNLGTPSGGRGAEPIVTGTASTDLNSVIAVQQGGRVDATARYKITDADGEIYGQTPIYIPTGFETVKGVTTGDGYQNPRGVVMPNGSMVVVAERWESTQGVTVYQRAQGVADWTAVVDPIWTTSTAFASDIRPSPQIWSVPSDTTSGVVLYCASLEVTATNVQTLRIDVSEDGGTNWRTGGRSNLRFDTTTIRYQIEDALWDAKGSQAVIVVRKYDSGGPTYTLLTYVSNDYGATWRQLTTSLINDVRIARVSYFCGVQYLAYIDGSNDLYVRHRTAAGGAWSVLKASPAGSANIDYSHLSFVILPSGQMFIYYRPSPNSGTLWVVASSDGGYTWGSPTDTTVGTPYQDFPYDSGGGMETAIDTGGAALANGIKAQDAIYYGGTVYLLGTLVSSDTVDNSVVALRMGSYSTLEWFDVLNYGTAFYPAQIPTSKDATATYTGASTQSVTLDATDQLVWAINVDNATGYVSNTYNYPVLALHWILGESSTGGDMGASYIACRVKGTDGATYAQAEVRVDADTRELRLRDVVAGTALGSAAVVYPANAPVEIFLAISHTTLKASAWYKLTTQDVWTEIAVNQTVTTAAGVTGGIEIGKLAASTALVHTLYYRRMGEDGWADGANELIGIPAMSSPDGTPDGMQIAWRGGPFFPANAWQVQGRGARPLELLSPYALNISPSDYWRGEDDPIGGGSDFRLVYDFGASYSGRIDSNLIGIVWANMPGVLRYVLSRWDGAAWQTVKTITTARSPFGAGGAVAFARTAATSYQIRPNGSNGSPAVISEGQYNGWWCHVQDAGGDSFAGKILRSTPGQFSTGSNVLQSMLEFDPATVVDVNGGGFAAVATAETAGTITLYPPDGAAITASTDEATRYWAITFTTAPGYSEPRGGALWFGPAFAFARPVRDGGSIRYATPQEMRAIGGSGAMSLQQTRRTRSRAMELPFDQILYQDGYNADGYEVGTLAFTGGSTARANIDNNIVMLRSLISSRGRSTPCALIPDGKFTADPGTTSQVFTGENFIYGIMSDSIDVTVGRGGYQFPASSAAGNQQGTSLLFVEVV